MKGRPDDEKFRADEQCCQHDAPDVHHVLCHVQKTIQPGRRTFILTGRKGILYTEKAVG